MISPLKEMRASSRQILKEQYVEICIKASLEICKKEIPKDYIIRLARISCKIFPESMPDLNILINRIWL